MRNNQDRLGAPSAPDAPAPPIEQKSSLFDFVNPTEFVDLPTKGKLYPEGHPLYGKETVEIRFMTAKDEDILTSRTLLKNGLALDRFIANVIIDKSIDIKTLVAADKNALLVAARITGFGSDYKTKITCPACTANSDYNFDLSDIKPYYGEEGVEISPSGTYSIELPKTKVSAEFRALTGVEETKLSKLAGNKRKKNLSESTLTDQLKEIIVSLNGETRRSLINRFVDVMPVPDSRHLRKEYKRLVPGLDMKHSFVCPSCEHEQEVEIPLTVDFFWPDR